MACQPEHSPCHQSRQKAQQSHPEGPYATIAGREGASEYLQRLLGGQLRLFLSGSTSGTSSTFTLQNTLPRFLTRYVPGLVSRSNRRQNWRLERGALIAAPATPCGRAT